MFLFIGISAMIRVRVSPIAFTEIPNNRSLIEVFRVARCRCMFLHAQLRWLVQQTSDSTEDIDAQRLEAGDSLVEAYLTETIE